MNMWKHLIQPGKLARFTRRRRYWLLVMLGGLMALPPGLLGARSVRAVENYADPHGPMFQGDFAGPPPPLSGQIRIVSWNIRYGEAVETAVAELRHNPHLRDADVLLLQEMDETGVAYIAQSLAYNYVYFPASVHAHHGRNFGNAVLSKWPLSQPEKVLLPYANPSNAQRRMAAKTVITIAGAPLVVYSVHTETYWLGQRGRSAQTAAIAADIPPGEGPVIVGGDFNTITRADVAELSAQFTAVGLEQVSAEAGPTVDVAGIDVVADHIFARSLPLLAAGAMTETAVSDHAPVWVTLAWEN